MKKTVVLLMVICLLLVGCSKPADKPAASTATTSTTADSATEKTFTMDEIAKYDGQNGNSAYVVVKGVVYDVTNVRAWPNGIHQGKYKAGQDVTDLLALSPHGDKVLEKLPVVGKIKK